MKTKKSINGTSKMLAISVMMVLIMALIGCDKNDDGRAVSSITAQPAAVSFTVLNTCDTGSTFGPGTKFDIKIKYSSANSAKINKLTFETLWSNGKGSKKETTDFSDSGSEIVHKYCYTLGDKDWVEITYHLVSVDGIVSNPSIIRINKPEGAN